MNQLTVKLKKIFLFQFIIDLSIKLKFAAGVGSKNETGGILYSDRRAEISSDTMLFRTYYFPFKKKIVWSAIESIELRRADRIKRQV